MTTAKAAPAAEESKALAVSGTPKKGVDCGRCDDWGTVVLQRGRTSYEEICPEDDCPAAARARQLRKPE